MPLTTSETIDAIIVKFKERFGAELSVNDSVIRNIEALPEGLYGSIVYICLLYTSPSPRDRQKSRMPSSA